MTKLTEIQKAIRMEADPEKAAFFPRFFKAGPGGYAEDDLFIGVTVPNCRVIARRYADLTLADIQQLLGSRWHEDRLTALILLTNRYEKAPVDERWTIYEFYLAHTKQINNWDLVDTSCYKIIGRHLYQNSDQLTILDTLAKSDDLWERRIAMVSTFYFLMKSDPSVTKHVAEILLHDNHDLIQKAVGWMLREMGKRVDDQVLVEFLATHYRTMPRMALRYAIERFSEPTRKKYLNGTI